ncbi:MAG: hypothetical protein IJU21_01945 [Bacteroidales bacterium]|nr:hypothetical protein [Bacteroidales bacterium]
MKTLRIIIATVLLVIPLSLGAQTKAETSLYGKTMNKPSLKAADKFLKKYPNSVYAPKVLQLKDSLLMADYIAANVSTISHDDAVSVAGAAADAIGWKKDGVEHVLALDPDLTLRILSPSGELEDTRAIPVYTMSGASPSLTGPMELVSPFGGKRQYVHFAYNGGKDEYVEVLYLPSEDIIHQALFYGNGDGTRIEGQSPEMIEGVNVSAEVAWLVARLRENPNLIQISKADILTDDSIQWWLEKNPKARTTATKLVFGKLDPESSIVEACKKARKEKGTGRNAAMFDIRGYTVICTVSGGEYTLVWCEPVCTNRNTQPYIRSIYFDNDGTTLNLFYYKGKTTFKKKISLPSRTLRHLK